MALTGNETLFVQGLDQANRPAATLEQTTTGAIALLASSTGVGETVNTTITTVGAGTLSAASVIGGLITRSGPVAAYTDTTVAATAIVAAIGAPFVGQSFYVKIKNTVNFTQTFAGGSGVTITGSTVAPPNSVTEYLVTLTSLSAISFRHISTVSLTNNTPEVVTALTTVGAGTITAAGIAGGVTTRSGATSAFTDTTDTADNIIAAQANAHVGVSWEYTYINNTVAPATLAGGSGVTVSGITTVGSGKSVRYLVTYTAASTVTVVGISAGTSTPGFLPNVLRCSAQTDVSTTGLVNVTGLTGQTLVAGATYKFRAVLPGLADGTSGQTYAFKYTTATLTSIEATGIGYTVSAVAVQHTTTTADATLLFDQAAALVMVILEGTMVVNAGGTVALQTGLHTGTTTGSTYLGASLEFIRIA